MVVKKIRMKNNQFDTYNNLTKNKDSISLGSKEGLYVSPPPFIFKGGDNPKPHKKKWCKHAY